MLIQDVRPPYRPETPPPEVMEKAMAEHYIKSTPQDLLITELFQRGVTIEDIFSQYYAMEAIADARHDEIFGNDEEGLHGRAPLTVGDAMLAGVVARDMPVTRRQPF